MFQLCGGPRLLAAAVMMVFAVTGILADGSLRFARAQDEMSLDFRETLGDHGQWVTHPRWGEVWVPTTTQENWRPYLLGHWVYTDEWGWYWLADEEWGWITYHYGRWVVDRDYGLGWIWVPGTQWSPAWVSWRQGDEVIGWAPMRPVGASTFARDHHATGKVHAASHQRTDGEPHIAKPAANGFREEPARAKPAALGSCASAAATTASPVQRRAAPAAREL